MSMLMKAALAAGHSTTPPGQQGYTVAGTYSWTCPDGVTSVSVVAIGGAGTGSDYNDGADDWYPAGGGAGLGYKNAYAVTPGNTYTVHVAGTSDDSYFVSTAVVKGGAGINGSSSSKIGGTGGTHTGDGGGNGGNGCTAVAASANNGGGGCAGYSGNGTNGTVATVSSSAATGGAASGGKGAAGGGGVGIFGEGSSGASQTVNGNSGFPGSSGTGNTSGGVGEYGGGGFYTVSGPTQGAPGAVRIIWPGDLRQFPSTRTADE